MNIEIKLKIALLFFDKIVIHSADVMRDQNVYKILKKYSSFITESVIEFLYSSSIETIEFDVIMKYATDKNEKGEKGLTYFINNQSFAKNVIELLQNSKNIIHRDYGMPSKERFIKLIQDDLKEQDLIQKDHSKGTSTLYQIIFNPDENGVTIQPEKARAFKEKIEDIIAGEEYSRQHILDDFDTILVNHDNNISPQPRSSGQRNKKESQYDVTSFHRNLVEERLCLLYANLNTSKHFIIDFHHEREKYLPFRVNTLDTYLRKFTKGKITAMQSISPEIIVSIRKSVDWKRFTADYFLSYFQWRSRQDTDVMNEEKKEISPVSHIGDYPELSTIILGGK